MRMCKECRFYQPPRWESNPVGDSALPSDRITSRTQISGKCTVSGRVTKPSDPFCDSFRERG